MIQRGCGGLHLHCRRSTGFWRTPKDFAIMHCPFQLKCWSRFCARNSGFIRYDSLIQTMSKKVWTGNRNTWTYWSCADWGRWAISFAGPVWPLQGARRLIWIHIPNELITIVKPHQRARIKINNAGLFQEAAVSRVQYKLPQALSQWGRRPLDRCGQRRLTTRSAALWRLKVAD